MFFKRSGTYKYIIVFLGNPGKKYEKTRHNVGFMVAESLASSKGLKINKIKFKSLTERCTIGGETCLLLLPQTYMNLSGEAVLQASNYYDIAPENIIVISDETSLPVGKIRIRKSGSAGGHNGLKSIISKLGTNNFPRMRIGVGSPVHEDYDMADWVLAGFTGEDAKVIKATVERSVSAIEVYITQGADQAMSQFNA